MEVDTNNDDNAVRHSGLITAIFVSCATALGANSEILHQRRWHFSTIDDIMVARPGRLIGEYGALTFIPFEPIIKLGLPLTKIYCFIPSHHAAKGTIHNCF